MIAAMRLDQTHDAPAAAAPPHPDPLPHAGRGGKLAFRPCPADINGREVGGGRATRQPGQVRKEAALTSAVRVARQPPTIRLRRNLFRLTLRREPTGPARSGRPDGKLRRASKGDRGPSSFEARPFHGLAPQDEAE